MKGADEVARRVGGETVDVLGPAHLMGLVLLGHGDWRGDGSGRPSGCCVRPGQACVTPGTSSGTAAGCTSLRRWLSGHTDEARDLLTDLESQRHPAYTLMEPEILLARAWVAVSQGSTSEAVAAAHGAADVARRGSSPAYEVLALHTALELGDHTVAARLLGLRGPWRATCPHGREAG